MVSDFDFPQVNRSVMIIYMKQPCVDWTNSLSDRAESEKENPYTLESINDDPAAYLIPEILDYISSAVRKQAFGRVKASVSV